MSRRREIKIIIDPEFQSLIPPLTKLERDQLEENLLEDGGCREPLLVWWRDNDDTRVLIDGHNRYEICTRLELGFEVELVFMCDTTREEVKEWIYKNQLGRRNLSLEDASELRGRMYNARKKAVRNATGANQHNEVKDQNDPKPTTAEVIAKETGVSAPTIKRDGKYAEAVDKVAKAVPDIRSKVRSREVTRPQVVEAAKHVGESEEATVRATQEPLLVKGRQPKCPDLRDTYCLLVTVENGDPILCVDGEPSSGMRLYSSSRDAELAQVEFERLRYGENGLEVVSLTEFFTKQSALAAMQHRGAE